MRESVELAEFYLAKRDTEHLKELDTEFHGVIYKATGNRHLERILTELHRNIRGYRKLSLGVPSRLLCSVKEHRDILDAIEAKDSALAEQLTKSHIEAALSNLLDVINEPKS